METDAFFAGMILPQLALTVLSGSLIHVLVPLLAIEDKESFSRTSWGFLQCLGILLGILAIFFAITSTFWVPWVVPGFDSQTKSLTVSLTQIQLVGMVLTGPATVLTAAYHAQQRFIWASGSGVLATFLAFLFLFFGLPYLGIQAAAWTMVLKSVLQALFLIPGIGPYHRPEIHNPAIQKAWRQIRPLLLGTSYYKTDQIVDRLLASMTPVGGVSLLHMALQIYGAGNQVLNAAIAAPVVPLLAQKAHRRDWRAYFQISKGRLLRVTIFSVLGFLFLWVWGQEILRLLFGFGRFRMEEVDKLWWILMALVGVLIGGAMGQILSTSFYARGETVVPTKIGVWGFSLGIGFKVLGFYLAGIIGIALGTSVYYFLNVFLLQWALSQHHGMLLDGGKQAPHA
jgi:putative peptidoglycan lipid II flippase